MQTIIHLLQELDILYRTETLQEYEQLWQRVEQQVQQAFPNFTIGHAEIYTAGAERFSYGGIEHVLVPIANVVHYKPSNI